MEEEQLKVMIERMVREALIENRMNLVKEGGSDPEKTRTPLQKYSSSPNTRNIVAANWKMNMTLADAREFARGLGDFETGDLDVVICSPIYLAPLLVKALSGTGIRMGAQNMHHEPKGAFTGEISPPMLRDAGCEYVILGHSERRHIFGERDEHINLKVAAAFNNGIIPILCVGETLDEKERSATFRVIRNQLRLSLIKTTPNTSRGLVVAYEPVWAIGTGRTASPGQAQNIHSFIRETLTQVYDFSTAKDIKILYGGSVTPDNAAGLIKEKDIDGFLVGGASLSPESLRRIVEAV